MNWILASETTPQDKSKEVLAAIEIKSKESLPNYIYRAVFPPQEIGGPWLLPESLDTKLITPIANKEVVFWTEISSPRTKNTIQQIEWQHNFPKTIWKYCDIDAAKFIISDQTLKFTHPSNFNDPFECYLEDLVFDISEACKEVEEEIEILRKMTLNLKFKPNSQWFEEAYKHAQMQKIKQSSVTCFSLNPNNSLMWAHYADKYNGVCFEFDNSVGSDNVFVDNKIIMEGKVFYDWWDKVNYCKDKRAGIAKIFLNKHSHWGYEDEYRYIKFQKDGIYKFNKEFLKGITFGLRCTEERKKEIILMCISNGLSHINFQNSKFNRHNIIYEVMDIKSFLRK